MTWLNAASFHFSQVSATFISSFSSSSSLQNEKCEINDATASRHLNDWSNKNRQRKQKACFYPAAGTLRFFPSVFLSHPLCTAVWTQREGWTPLTGGRGAMGGGWWWDKDLRDSSVNWVWHGQFYSGCSQTAAVPPSIYKVNAVLKTSELTTQLRPGFTHWGDVNRAQIPL